MKNNIYANATVVTGLSVAERALGFLYRIVLSRLLGEEGLGLYQVALSVFALFLTLCSGGIPVTVSRTVAKHRADGDERAASGVVGAGVAASLLFTLPVCLFFCLFGRKMTFLFSDERTYDVFRILLLGLTCNCVYAVFRGHFWGRKAFLFPSVADFLEESMMVIVGVLLLQSASEPLHGAKLAAWAVVLSYLFSFALSGIFFVAKGGKMRAEKGQLPKLLRASTPVTAVRAVGALVNSAIAVLLPAMLVKSGMDEREALRQFGAASGMVTPMLMIPATLIGSLALVLVPELSEDFHKKRLERLRRNLARGIKFSFLVACALIPFYFALGEDFGKLIFHSPYAGKMLKNSCLLLLPMSLSMISTAMLNSLGFEKQTLSFYFIGAAANLLCVVLLSTFCGGYAYVLGLFLSYLFTALCNLIFLAKKCPIYPKRRGQVCVHEYLPHLFAMLFLSLSAAFLHGIFKKITGETASVALTAALLCAETLFAFWATGCIPRGILKKLLPHKNRR